MDTGSSPIYYLLFSSVFFLLLFTTLSYKTPIMYFEWRWQSDFGESFLVTTVRKPTYKRKNARRRFSRCFSLFSYAFPCFFFYVFQCFPLFFPCFFLFPPVFPSFAMISPVFSCFPNMFSSVFLCFSCFPLFCYVFLSFSLFSPVFPCFDICSIGKEILRR